MSSDFVSKIIPGIAWVNKKEDEANDNLGNKTVARKVDYWQNLIKGNWPDCKCNADERLIKNLSKAVAF